MKNWSKIKCYLVPVICTAIIALLGASFVSQNEWYRLLVKPPFYPPPEAFTVVWSILYTLIAISAIIVCLSEKPALRTAAVAYLVNGALNAFWPYLFFDLKNPQAAFWELLILILSTILLIRLIKRMDKTALYLLYPYLAWIIFAAVLNYTILMLN